MRIVQVNIPEPANAPRRQVDDPGEFINARDCGACGAVTMDRSAV
jgi:hypothetical protein